MIVPLYDNGGPDGVAQVLHVESIDAREAVQNDPERYSLEPPPAPKGKKAKDGGAEQPIVSS